MSDNLSDDRASQEPASEQEAVAAEDSHERALGEELALAPGPPSLEALSLAARAIEAIVMVSTDPVPETVLAQVTELPVTTIRAICQELASGYASQERGFQFAEVAGGWRYQSHGELADYVERYVREGQTARLSGAALETLAIIAYKQPISRAQASSIRGVNVDGVLRTLEQRGFVEEVARDEGPGQAILFGTTVMFLERLGIASVKDLPPLGEFVPSAAVVEALEDTLRVGPEDTQLVLTEEDASEEAND